MKSSSPCYLRLPDVLRLFPVSRSSWYAGIKSGRYPRGHRMSVRVTGWLESDINALIERTAA
jgi:prophage regulatory protein